MSPHESAGPGNLTEVGPARTPTELNELSDYRFEGLTEEYLLDLLKGTLGRCDDLFLEVLSSENLSYDQVIRPLGEIDDLVLQLCYYLNTISLLHPEGEVRAAADGLFSELLRESNVYLFDFQIGNIIDNYSKTKEAQELDGEEATYLKCVSDWIEAGGRGLPRSQRKKVRKLWTALPDLELQFLANLAEDNNHIFLKEKHLEGLDEQTKKDFLIDLGDGRYALNLIESSCSAFLSAASNRKARKAVYKAFHSRAKDENGLILEKVVQSRQKIARLLGYSSWLDLSTMYNLAKSPDEIRRMYAEVIGPLTVQAKQELAVMERMLEADGHAGPLQEYDWKYYEEKLLQEKYGSGLSKAREYLPLPAVLDGIFELTGKMFGLEYRYIESAVWHPDVFTIAVDNKETGEMLGTIIMDLYPREGKYKHCCTQPLISGRGFADGSYRQPSSVIVANIAKPIDGEPALLSQKQRVDIAFHEFGHALHHLMNRAKFASLTSLAAEIDFVEIPSQLMERWAWDKNILAEQARHFRTGEQMPSDMINALLDSKDVNLAIDSLRSISLGLFDMSLHDSLKRLDIQKLWNQAVATSAFPAVEGTFYPATFDHLVSDYGGNYYSYFYDEFYCSDLFTRFQQEGLDNAELGSEYRRKMIEPGASIDGAEMVRNFLGREMDKRVFLRNLGTIAVAES